MRIARIRGIPGTGECRLEGGWAVPLDGQPARQFKPADLLAPCAPTKIVAVARNYRDHARELGGEPPEQPLFFLKPPSAVIGPGDPIPLPGWSSEVHHEAELAVVVGRRPLRNVAAQDVRAGILGFTCVNDVTARDVQRAEGQFTRAKGADGFCPIGPWIETVLPDDVTIECRVDGETRQRGRMADMIFTIEQLVSFISRVMTLAPGDVVATGTPSGVGPLRAGQTVEVDITGIGALSNPVVGP